MLSISRGLECWVKTNQLKAWRPIASTTCPGIDIRTNPYLVPNPPDDFLLVHSPFCAALYSKYDLGVEAIRFETTVGQEGIVHVPDVREGERVEVIVLKLQPEIKPRRKGGWIKGKITIHSDFDEPIPGMEDYQ